VIEATPTQSAQTISYSDSFTISNSMIVSAQYKSSTRGFNAYDNNSANFPMPYYHTTGIVINSSSIDTTVYTKVVIILKRFN